MDDNRWLSFVLSLTGFLTALCFTMAFYALYNGEWFEDELQSADIVRLDPLPVDQETSAVRITTPQRGMVAVYEQAIEQLQLPFVSFSADSLTLTKDGEPIAFYIDSNNPDNEVLYFYAEGMIDSFAAPPVYILTTGSGVQMIERDAEPSSPGVVVGTRNQQWEENLRFFPHATGDRWLGAQIFAPVSLDIPLDEITPTAAGGAHLSLELWSSSETEANPDHHAEVHLNGTRLIEKYWDGITDVTSERTLGEGSLLPTGNILTITALGDMSGGGESIYVNAIELSYEGYLTLGSQQLEFQSAAQNVMVTSATDKMLLFDISDPQKPARLINMRVDNDEGVSFKGSELGATFIALRPATAIQPQLTPVPVRERLLTSAEQGADYIAIIPPIPQFDETVAPLLAQRQEQGLAVQAIALDQIFDEFSFGRPTPQAIRDFLLYTSESWSPAPRYVLLVGDASYDIYDFSGGDNQDLLPAHFVPNKVGGIAASDGWLTMQGEDVFNGELAIGRFPVQTREQLATLVRKTIAYETDPVADNSWISRALLVSDDQPDFMHASTDLATMLRQNGFNPLRFDVTVNETIQDSIVSAVNQGVGILSYVGEGDYEVWGDERVLQADNSADLINGTRLPILTTFTTQNGYFTHPHINTLVEQLLWADNGGIVAAIAPSGRAPLEDQTRLGEDFYQTLLADPATTLGEALQQTRRAGVSIEAAHTLNLFGDPALRLNRPNQ